MKHYYLQELKRTVISGIYKIDFPNGKVYIGQSQNIYKRIQEHNSRANLGYHGSRDIQLCEKAIAKYLGEVIELDILEQVDMKQLDEREKYWIKYFDSTNKEKGYNLIDKGNVSGRRGIDHVNASFNQEQLNEIIDLLINHTELSLIDIANKYKVHPETIRRISNGQSYTNPNLNYPLRSRNHDSQKKTKVLDYFADETELIKLKEDLKYSWWLQMDNGDLYNKYKITRKLLYAINQGKIFSNIGDYTYPIRTKSNKNLLTREQVLEILDYLKNTNHTMEVIGNKYGINRCTIAKINKGDSYPIKDYKYPARITSQKDY